MIPNKNNEARRDSRLEDVRVPARITDQAKAVSLPCTIRDFSRGGCRVHGSAVHQLGPNIEIAVDGIGAPIPGRIVWSVPDAAGIEFGQEDREPDDEKAWRGRKERRHPARIEAGIDIGSGAALIPGRITEVSRSGCRLESSYIDMLPDEIRLKVPELKVSITGRVRWRGEGHAGIELMWDQATPLG